jgi:transcriptional regulator with XRE-family HTH domain
MHFAENIKLLRKRRGRTQEDVSVALEMKRSTLSGYENKVAQPGVEVLIAFSNYFNVAIDTLIRVDLCALSESQLSQLERGFDVFVKGSGLRVLVSTVDSSNRENIELVPEKAKAGYATGYSNPEYISELPVFQLPFLSREKKFRTFQISGDSMLPLPHGCWVTGEFVQDWNHLKDGDFCLVLTLDDGIVFKMIENRLATDQSFVLHSLNTSYKPYEVKAESIREIWKFVHYISAELPDKANTSNLIHKVVSDLKTDLQLIKKKMGI